MLSRRPYISWSENTTIVWFVTAALAALNCSGASKWSRGPLHSAVDWCDESRRQASIFSHLWRYNFSWTCKRICKTVCGPCVWQVRLPEATNICRAETSNHSAVMQLLLIRCGEKMIIIHMPGRTEGASYRRAGTPSNRCSTCQLQRKMRHGKSAVVWAKLYGEWLLESSKNIYKFASKQHEGTYCGLLLGEDIFENRLKYFGVIGFKYHAY